MKKIEEKNHETSKTGKKNMKTNKNMKKYKEMD